MEHVNDEPSAKHRVPVIRYRLAAGKGRIEKKTNVNSNEERSKRKKRKTWVKNEIDASGYRRVWPEAYHIKKFEKLVECIDGDEISQDLGAVLAKVETWWLPPIIPGKFSVDGDRQEPYYEFNIQTNRARRSIDRKILFFEVQVGECVLESRQSFKDHRLEFSKGRFWEGATLNLQTLESYMDDIKDDHYKVVVSTSNLVTDVLPDWYPWRMAQLSSLPGNLYLHESAFIKQVDPSLRKECALLESKGGIIPLNRTGSSTHVINLLLAGTPKTWWIIPQGQRQRLNDAIQDMRQAYIHIGSDEQATDASIFIFPRTLDLYKIDYTVVRQDPEEIFIALPGAIYQGINHGDNVAICMNYADDSKRNREYRSNLKDLRNYGDLERSIGLNQNLMTQTLFDTHRIRLKKPRGPRNPFTFEDPTEKKQSATNSEEGSTTPSSEEEGPTSS